MLNFAIKNLYYEEREQLDSGGGGALSQAAGSFYNTLYSHPKMSSSVHQKVLTTFLEEDSSIMAYDYAIKKSFRHGGVRGHRFESHQLHLGRIFLMIFWFPFPGEALNKH